MLRALNHGQARSEDQPATQARQRLQDRQVTALLRAESLSHRTEVLSKTEFNGVGGLRTHISVMRITIGFPER
jgi:hypothetical protein